MPKKTYRERMIKKQARIAKRVKNEQERISKRGPGLLGFGRGSGAMGFLAASRNAFSPGRKPLTSENMLSSATAGRVEKINKRRRKNK